MRYKFWPLLACHKIEVEFFPFFECLGALRVQGRIQIFLTGVAEKGGGQKVIFTYIKLDFSKTHFTYIEFDISKSHFTYNEIHITKSFLPTSIFYVSK
jgi:hypothetical protein